MSYNHVVVWLDHSEAHIIHFNAEAAENEHIKLHAKHTHSGTSSDGQANSEFREKIVHSIAEAREILIVGPGLEKLALMKHIIKHHHDVSERVMSVETVDHPTDGQLLKYARKYFAKADLFV